MDESLIYLDHNATTPLDEEVFEVMRPYFIESYGNAASRQHALGKRAAEAVDLARAQVARALGADPREIVWTSGATEANNLALKGVAGSPAYAKRRHVVTVRTEHKAVLDPCNALEEDGFEITRLKVDGEGLLDLDRVGSALREDTLLVSVMHANNEIGVLHPIGAIGTLCKERGILFHTDATQSAGREPIDVEAMGIDLLSLSAHKFYGPKGVGALYVRRRGPRVRCRALFDGGGHERGYRSGTLNVPGLVGLAAALGKCVEEREQEKSRLQGLRNRFEADLLGRIEGSHVNGSRTRRLANTTNICFEGTDAESLLDRMPTLCASSSAACTSAQLQPSHVLAALGLDDARKLGSLRFSLGRKTTAAELDRAVELLSLQVARERSEGPRPFCPDPA
ncbi:MAG: IscS subfamily cysteine desulfurase [Planctomycetes bacterium]|jgi:cysteine desulfurase|nr:IscS subfamily cysteine desulfurase [Planctomycetota bacterium]